MRDLLAFRDLGDEGRAGKGSWAGVGPLEVSISPDLDLLAARAFLPWAGVGFLSLEIFSPSFLAVVAVAAVRFEFEECVRGAASWKSGKWKLIVRVSSGSATALLG